MQHLQGVLIALTVPTTPDTTESPLEKLEHALTKPVNFVILPLFALGNTNIRFESETLTGLYSNMGLGIFFGLILGKPLGIFIMSWISIKLNLGSLPVGTKWSQIIALGVLAGIGFTMSIFISMLSYSDELLQTGAKFIILVTSVLAGIIGYTALRLLFKN